MRPTPLVVFVTALAAACASFGTEGGGASTPADGGTSDGGTGSFCERYAQGNGAPAYCRDFDDGTDILFDWNGSAISPLGAITAGGIANSPPFSLKSRLEADAGDCAYARVNRDVEVPQNMIHLEFAVRVGGDGADANLGSSYMVEEFGTCRLILQSGDTGGDVHEQFPNGDPHHALSRFPKDKTWARYELDVNRQTRALVVRIDGVNAFTSAQTLDPACDISRTTVRLLLGQHCEANAPTPREIHIDDLVLTGR